MNPSRKGRVRVMAGPRLIEFAGPERVRCLLMALNARIACKRKTQAIVAAVLECGATIPAFMPATGTRRNSRTTPKRRKIRVWTVKKIEPG